MSNNEILKGNNRKTEDFENIKKSDNKPTGISVITREILKDKLALASLIILVILFGIIFIGSLFANQDEIMKISLLDKYAIPMKEGFWLGSDSGGRSILGQLNIRSKKFDYYWFCNNYFNFRNWNIFRVNSRILWKMGG